jgi:hypothetical protein
MNILSIELDSHQRHLRTHFDDILSRMSECGRIRTSGSTRESGNTRVRDCDLIND